MYFIFDKIIPNNGIGKAEVIVHHMADCLM
jgi:hypothetical protein